MKANKLLKAKVKNIVMGIRSNMPAGTYLGVSKYVNMHVHMEIENGESIDGYQYLHGTNASAGDFQIIGTLTKYLNGNTRFDI